MKKILLIILIAVVGCSHESSNHVKQNQLCDMITYLWDVGDGWSTIVQINDNFIIIENSIGKRLPVHNDLNHIFPKIGDRCRVYSGFCEKSNSFKCIRLLQVKYDKSTDDCT